VPDPQPTQSTPEPVTPAPSPADAPADETPSTDEAVDVVAAEPAPPEPGQEPTLTEDELLRAAVPATVRRAPRYGAFMTAGALVGLIVGLVLAVVVDTGAVTDSGGVLPFLGGSNGPRLLSALAGAVLGIGVGAGLALWADRRSLRR